MSRWTKTKEEKFNDWEKDFRNYWNGVDEKGEMTIDGALVKTSSYDVTNYISFERDEIANNIEVEKMKLEFLITLENKGAKNG